MMLPPSTFSPPNFFTPSILGFESRPLREEPPAFLWAMVGSPYAVMPVILIVVRWERPPRLRWVFLRRFFLNAMVFSPRPWLTISAATEAPERNGVPAL